MVCFLKHTNPDPNPNWTAEKSLGKKIQDPTIDRCWVCEGEGNTPDNGLLECCGCQGKRCHVVCLTEWKEMLAGTTEADTCGDCGKDLKPRRAIW